jgi:hypothetical protein
MLKKLDTSHTFSLKHISQTSASKANITSVDKHSQGTASFEAYSPDVNSRLKHMTANFSTLNLSPNMTCEEEKSPCFNELYSAVKQQ